MDRPQAIFHLAFPITDVDQAKAFYADGLGCDVGRENAASVILNLCGHQLVGHVTQTPPEPQQGIYPRHFGLVFSEESDWETLLNRAMDKGLSFYQAPKRRFPGELLEHHTFFLVDPFQNLLEFKYYCHPEAIFGAANYAKIGDV
ncbi:MAG: VOC family protein [Synechococcales cyanobacterium T60_A2020_003]|nr:VOC family protein [Synechococcales cyanobacterium T60_A2020_003]